MLSLVRALPAESAFRRSYTGGATWGWVEEATTSSVELLVALIRVVLLANGAKRSQVPKPLHIERPWEPIAREIERVERARRPPRRQATVDETVSTLSRLFTPPVR